MQALHERSGEEVGSSQVLSVSLIKATTRKEMYIMTKTKHELYDNVNVYCRPRQMKNFFGM